jgi:alpha-mannosidase
MDTTTAKKLFLVCNAHIDPVWLWNWEEGLVESLSTFRMAARFCEEFSGFVFCHNESLLYEWVEEHDPELFQKIKQLVAARKWHVMGGWYLQPDCNLPAGESLVRQILVGKCYFQDKFQVEPTIAANLDSFGHSRGLAQILSKSGYRGYLFCRPDNSTFSLKEPDFVWVGYDSSRILCHRPPDHYNSEAGKAALKVRKWLAANANRPVGMLLWGIGNHGGGPSRADLQDIARLQSESAALNIEHATPEEYFDWLETRADSLEPIDAGFNPWGVGCYTSMARVKRKHRQLENSFFLTERMATNALLQAGVPYPKEELRQALKELLFCEFHDALAGSSVSSVEESVLQKLDHGLETLVQIRTRIFLKLLAGQAEAAPGEFPIFVYNSHPHDTEEILVCEFQPQEPNFDKSTFWLPELVDEHGCAVPLQLEKESCNIATEQRKRIVFRARLRAATMHRFSCRLRTVPAPAPAASMTLPPPARLAFHNDTCSVEISTLTGLIDRYVVAGADLFRPGAFLPMVIKDSADPWGMRVRSFRNLEGIFRLMTPVEAAAFAGIDAAELAPVRVIEQGPVRTVIEALFVYGSSRICMRYRIPARGNEIEIEALVFWEERDRMLKLSIPTRFQTGKCFGQSAYGVDGYELGGDEGVAQQWLAIQSGTRERMLTIINDRTYGYDFADGELRLSLLRSPAYAGHPTDDSTPIVRQDRFENRMDQGEHRFTFWLNSGPAMERLTQISREALSKNQPCLILCAFPSGTGSKPVPGIRVSDPAVQAGAWKLSEDGKRLILRLFETTGHHRNVVVTIPGLSMEWTVELGSFELKSLAIDRSTQTAQEVDLLERGI